ncbi:MAG TPA: hypothetical protein VLK66_17255 [Longimicrobium sp.]|nr:hypothetical protein [Longimicrobium sp.]
MPMNKAGLACVLALALVGGACASAPVRDGEGRTATPPLFVVDGRIVVDGDGTRIDPDSILDVKVLGGEQAMWAYGARGEHGAVLIATRPAAADAGGAGCWLANGCNDVALPPPRPAAGYIIRDQPSIQQGEPPLFVINDRGCKAGACGAVSLGDITGVWVVTGPAASALYGTAGVNGVVIITTRHPRARR